MFLKVSQFLTWPIAFVYFNLLYHLNINGRENLDKVHSPFIIIVNHFSFLDGFLFRLVLGFNTPHLPLRFMAVKRFAWRWLNFLSDVGIIDLIYGLFGTFVVVPGRGIEKNLEEAKKIINNKGNVVIYPEGRIVINENIASFKNGASILASITGAPVLPVSFRPGSRILLRRFLTVNIGEPLYVSTNADVNHSSIMLRDKVVELWNKR